MTSSSKSRNATSATTIDEALALKLLPQRAADAHKWSVGGVLIVGGSPSYIGAPALAALGAGRSGAGIISIASPRSAMGAIASIVPEASYMPLPEGDRGMSGGRAAEKVRERLDKFSALVVGPGLGDDEYADSVMQALIGVAESRTTSLVGFSVSHLTVSTSKPESATILGGKTPAVIDADALNWLARQGESWPERFAPRSIVLTPHVGEMSRLTGLEPAEIVADPGTVARRFAATWKQIVVLKGTPTVVSDGDRLHVANAAPRALATAGSGDVLAGSIGAFLAQGLAPFDASVLAVYAGVRAAEVLTERYGTLGVVAGDLPIAIAEVLASLEKKKGD